MKTRPSGEKRRKEMLRQERNREKEERRKQRKKDRLDPPAPDAADAAQTAADGGAAPPFSAEGGPTGTTSDPAKGAPLT